MKKVFLICAILFGVLALNAGCSEVNSKYLIGKIKSKGSEPHTYLVIEDIGTKQDYKIKNYKEFKLEKKQNKRVKLKAIITKKAIGPGFPAVIKVIAVD